MLCLLSASALVTRRDMNMSAAKTSYNFRKNTRVVWILLVPPLLVYIVFLVLPILQSFYFSFFSWTGMVRAPLVFVGLRNFTSLLSNDYFPLALTNTVTFVVVSTVVQLTIAFLLALALSKKFFGYRVFKVVFFTPQILTLTSIAIMWYFILFPGTGPVTLVARFIGGEAWDRNWLVESDTALLTVILVNSWISIGFYMVLFLSAIVSINSEVLEAADLDGSHGLHRIANVILPMMWEVIKVAVVLQITGNLKMFEFVYLMTRGGPDGLTNTLGTLLYNEAFEYQHFGIGSAIAVVIFLLSILTTLISLRFLRREAT